MGCPVCSKSNSIKKALTGSFGKQDIQDLLNRLKETRRRDVEAQRKKTEKIDQ